MASPSSSLPPPAPFMTAQVRRPDIRQEFHTTEGCWILESWNDPSDPAVSISRARVPPGITTQLHRLHGVVERYLITEGSGVVQIGALEPEHVDLGDLVIIPAGTPQSICNDGPQDLLFYCMCTPRFTPDCYEAQT